MSLPGGLNAKVTNVFDMSSRDFLDSVGPLKKVFISANKSEDFSLITLNEMKGAKNESEFLEIFAKKGPAAKRNKEQIFQRLLPG